MLLAYSLYKLLLLALIRMIQKRRLLTEHLLYDRMIYRFIPG